MRKSIGAASEKDVKELEREHKETRTLTLVSLLVNFGVLVYLILTN